MIRHAVELKHTEALRPCSDSTTALREKRSLLIHFNEAAKKMQSNSEKVPPGSNFELHSAKQSNGQSNICKGTFLVDSFVM